MTGPLGPSMTAPSPASTVGDRSLLPGAWKSPHTLIALLALVGILVHLALRFLAGLPRASSSAPLVAVLLIGGVPQVLNLVWRGFRGEFGWTISRACSSSLQSCSTSIWLEPLWCSCCQVGTPWSNSRWPRRPPGGRATAPEPQANRRPAGSVVHALCPCRRRGCLVVVREPRPVSQCRRHCHALPLDYRDSRGHHRRDFDGGSPRGHREGPSDVTSEAARVVVIDTSLSKVDELIHLSHRLRRVALQSAIGGMLLSGIGMTFATFGMMSPVAGAVAQEGIDLLAVLNALRTATAPSTLTDFRTE